MSVLNDLLSDLFERNTVRISGGITIGLVEGGIKIKGELGSIIKDRVKSKTLANLVVPLGATVSIREMKIAIPSLRQHRSNSSSTEQ